MATKKVKEAKFPATPGACIDRAYTLRAKRLELEHQAEEMKTQEAALRKHIFDTFRNAEIDGARGSIAIASIGRKTVGRVNDWDRFTAWVAKTKSFDLLTRKLNDAACRERFDAKKVIPGVEPFPVTTLSLTVVKGKKRKG